MVVRQRGEGQGFGVLTQHSNCLGRCRSGDLQPTALCHADRSRRVWKKVMGCYCIAAHTLLCIKYSASQNYRIKPHGQLVRVSLTHYCASTPRLSTLWSSTTLQCTQGARDILSSGKFHA